MTEVARPLIQDLNKIMMFTDTPGAPGKRSKLTWSVRDGNPRVSVFTNDPRDTAGKGIIYCPMNPETFYAAMRILENVIKSKETVSYKFDSLISVRDTDGNPKGNEKTLLSEFWIGKDDNQMVWISCMAPNRPKIKFVFRISEYHKIYKDGTPLTESEASCMQAYAAMEILKNAFYPLVSALRLPNTAAAQNNVTAAKPQQPKQDIAAFEDLVF